MAHAQEERSPALSPERRSGVVTLLFTDVVGSTALKQQLGDRAGVALVEQHHALVRQTLAQFEGAEEIDDAGDSFLVLFPVPSEAVKCALMLQGRLGEFNRGGAVPITDRMGLHLGEVILQEDGPEKRDVRGIQVDTCARVMALAQGGQILMTRPVFDNARQSLKGEEVQGIPALEWLNHGRFELKGVAEPVEICEVRSAGDATLAPPTTSEKARRVEAAEGEAVLGWRPAVGQAVPNTKWILEQKLGEGGFGEVWVGRHQTLKEQHVFKFCFRADRVRSLKREVTLFRLMKERVGEHPNIVRIHNVYFDQPPYYLEEEFVSGKDLRSWCEAQGEVAKLPLELRLEIVAQAADALQAAHDAGIIHRDVKPGNILVREVRELTQKEGETIGENGNHSRLQLQAKLTDFGIGQLISEDVLKHVTSSGFTQTMLDLGRASHTGTQLYVAPELWEGKPASTRSDIYSLGVVLYQLLVGDFKRPVTTDWADDIPDPLLREDLHHCFAGRPEDRFAAAGLLAKKLRGLPERRTERERQEAQKAMLERTAYRRGIIRTATIASLVVAVIAVLAWQVRSKELAKYRQAMLVRDATIRLTVASGLSPADSGDWLAAGLWFSEAFVLDETFRIGAEGELSRQTHRLRMNSLLRQSPRLEQMWFDEGTMSGGFDSGGQHVLLGGTNGYGLYRIQSGQKVSPRVGQGCKVASLCPDGRRAVTAGGSTNSIFALWDLSSGAQISFLRERAGDQPFRGDCDYLQFSPDGRYIAAVIPELEGCVLVWDADTGRLQGKIAYADDPNVGWANTNGILAVRFDSTGERLVTTGKDKRAVIWEWKTGRALHVLEGHGSWVYNADFGNIHTNWVVTCSFDRTACLWDLNADQFLLRRPELRVRHESDAIRDVQFRPDDRVFVTGGLGTTVRCWDTETGQMVPPILRNHDRVMQVDWSADARRLLALTWDGVVRIWRVDPEKLAVQPTTADFSDDGRLALTYDRDAVRLRNSGRGQTVAVGPRAGTNVLALSFAGGPDSLFTLSRGTGESAADGTQLQVWDFSRKTPLGPPLLYDPSWAQLVCAPGGRRFAFFRGEGPDSPETGGDGVVVWEPGGGSAPRTNSFQGEIVESVAFDQAGRRLAVGSHVRGSDSGVLRLVDLETPGEAEVLRRHTQHFADLTFSRDDHWLAAAAWDITLNPADAVVWRVPEAGRPFGQPSFLHHLDGVLYAAFSDSGKMLATASEDQTAIVWRLAKGAWQPSLRPLRCRGQVYLCAFSHNGRWLATANRTPEAQQMRRWDGEVRIWDIENNEPVGLPLAFPEKLRRLEFVAQDTRLFVERWVPPAAPKRWLIDLAVTEGSAERFLLRAELLSAQRSFLSGETQHLPQALRGNLSAEEALMHATSIGPLRRLTKEDCRELWLYLSSGTSPRSP